VLLAVAASCEGGGQGEVFVGYYGRSAGAGDWTDPDRHSGKLDRVRRKPDGSVQVDRMDLVSSVSAQFWENRRVDRLLYDHYVRDLAALPDGRLAVASFSAVVLWDPAASRHATVAGLPKGTVQRLELDQRVSPPALHVATEQGAAALRVLPPWRAPTLSAL